MLSSGSIVQSKEVEHHNQQKIPSPPNMPEGSNGGQEEDEDEDIDFNPFLKETSSPEASSNLSTENEGLGVDLVDNQGSSSVCKKTNLLSKLTDEVQDCTSKDSEDDAEEVVMQCQVSVDRKSAWTPQPETENILSSQIDSVEDVNKGELTDSRNSNKLIMDLDDEDAICKRTRAHYSLANFTLDELETFLQETDDDDDLQNVDDEQEYRRFLASVLQDVDNKGEAIQENKNVDDEDEENDADFEIEIEEALDSDLDEITTKYGEVGRRPETRQNRRQKVSVQSKKKLLGQANRPLRPLLPSVPNAQMVSYPALNCPSSITQSGLVNGFTPHQIGQLHCLIHEHVQLLIQVFSLCVLDTSRQHIAGEAQRMISEVVHRRDEVLSWRKVSYPDFCFHPPYIYPSSFASIPQNETTPSKGRNNEYVHGGHLDPIQTSKDSLWMPLINGPVLSILDIAPLSLVGRYMTDVATTVQEHKKRHVDSMFESHFEREPLFPFSSIPSSAEKTNTEVLRSTTAQGPSTVPSSSAACQPPKKTLAAALVESTKKQSVALAPKKIVKLAQRFYPLFNSALFPHKPPPTAVANRVLFTDAEDELLAMGLMEYNTDWKAIQQRFLPCKSKHQIFVRQKNRCSSKAPENPIKAVRRMKTSPLTAEEMARIHEGLRVLKLDWMSVWKFIVPYRDPSLLPRQWRIALGTQKSYKSDATKREKRRLYESRRRKCKAEALASWQTAPGKEISEDYLVDNTGEGNKSGDDDMDEEDEAYVHEAFLADWRPGNSGFSSSQLPLSSLSRRDLQPQEGSSCVGGTQFGDGYMHEFLPTSEQSQCLQASHFTHVRYSASYTVASNHFDPEWISKSSKGQISMRPYRVRRRNVARLVRLAPDLPPVNLPPSVRVISQSAFKSYQSGSFHSSKISPAQVAKSGSTSFHDLNKSAELDLQMHPLLFQTPEDGRLVCSPINCSTTSASTTFNFLPGNQLLQPNFPQFSKPQREGSTIDHFYKSLRSKENHPLSSCAIDFHPLLQRTDDLNNDPVVVDLESFQGNSGHHQNPSDSVMIEAQVDNSPSEKANELDLEIHLSSTSKEKVIGLADGGNRKESQNINNPSRENSSSCRDQAMFTECNIVGDQYLPEIVMEQEELSDSEEEIGEDVEFECEEMADSEGEESDCEQLIKESTIVMVEEEVLPNEDFMAQEEGVSNDNYNHQRCGPRILCGPKASVHATSRGNSRSRESRVMEKRKHSTDSTLQLTLHSSMKGSSTHLKPKHEERGNGDDQAGKNLPSRPNRSCKRMLMHPLDTLQRFHPGTTIFTPTRKPRKRLYRNDSTGKSSQCISTDKLVDCRPEDDTCLRIDIRTTKEDGQGTAGVRSPKAN